MTKRMTGGALALTLAVACLAACARPEAPTAARPYGSPAQDAVGNPVSADPKLNRQFQ